MQEQPGYNFWNLKKIILKVVEGKGYEHEQVLKNR